MRRKLTRAPAPKVFCIGFNKTGTTSLHRFFEASGLASAHNIVWPTWSRLPKPAPYFEQATCYSDGENADFTRLDDAFPEALFVLNTRDTRDWVRSRVKHVMRGGHPDTFAPGWQPRNWGWMAKTFFADEALAIDSWLVTRALYHRHARLYFADNPRFFEIDITAEPDWAGRLSGVLRDHGFKLTPPRETTPQHHNARADTEIEDQALLSRYLALADTRIAAIEAQIGALD